MVKKPRATLNEIEQTQMMLRESIEATKKLSDQSDYLLKRRRRELDDEA